MHKFELTLKLKIKTMRKINKTGPGTARKSKSVLEPEREPPDNLSQYWNPTRNRQKIRVSSRTGTGRNMDPLQQWLRTISCKLRNRVFQVQDEISQMKSPY